MFRDSILYCVIVKQGFLGWQDFPGRQDFAGGQDFTGGQDFAGRQGSLRTGLHLGTG